MSLRLKLKAEEFDKSFAIFDCTGDYSGDNKGGWGGGINPRKQDITSSIIEVEGPPSPPAPNFDPIQAALNTPPGSYPYVTPGTQGAGALNPIAAKLELLDNFPNDKNLGYEILPNAVGGKTAVRIMSGKYTIRWTVLGTDVKGKAFKAQTMLVVVFMKDVYCCVDKHLKYLTKNAFEVPKEREIIKMNALLFAACKSQKCGLFDQANETIQYLNQQCACINC